MRRPGADGTDGAAGAHPAAAGRPEDSQRPEQALRPEHTQQPQHTQQPPHTRRPEHSRPPAGPGLPEHIHRPADAERPGGGPPADGGRRREGPWSRLRRPAALYVPVLFGVADALLVNGVTFGLELNVSLVAAAVLLFRRRFPVLVFLATLPGILIGYVWFAPMIALYTVAARRTDRRLPALCAPLLAAAHFVPWPVSDLELTAYRENTLTLIDSCVTSVGPIALGLLVRTRRELADRVAELTRSRAHADRLLAERVVGTERARLAREMHDVVAHQVSLISLQAGAVQISTADPKAREGARTIRELSVRTLDELRHMVGILRKAGGGAVDLTPQPRLADLPRLIEVSALDVTYQADYAHGAPEWDGRPEAVERAAFRTVQEALTNVRKHAPGARVEVRVSERDPAGNGLLVEVRNGPPDAGATAPRLPGGGHGLVGLRERAQSLGGSFDARPTRGGGFVVRADLPWHAAPAGGPGGGSPPGTADDRAG
ncbi:sensor histidine kinase [Streptomyces sp. NPDC018031]|uniref:sensor histidine kinase n=1 Tax=Streptomyces sp. NPDC018031 TaxID=3365033 RepID=UPI0037BCE69A